MSVILEFRKVEADATAQSSRSASRDPRHRAEVIIFPGVRIERSARRGAAGGLAAQIGGSEAARATRPGDGAD